MQQQTLLALLLLALTALAAVGGGMKPREPFTEHEDESGMPMPEEPPVENGDAVAENGEPVVMEEEEPVVMEGEDDEDGPVEGFTGNMYAGF